MWSLETAGPAYIKLSQWASTRLDLLPARLCSALARLQRDSAPHSWHHTNLALEEELGRDWEMEVRLEREVVGSGCCAQVYKGHLNDGSQAWLYTKLKLYRIYMRILREPFF